jgi:hypothetical protein
LFTEGKCIIFDIRAAKIFVLFLSFIRVNI